MILKMAFKNLKSHGRKNLIALIAIASGFISINLFEGYIEGAQKLFKENYEVRNAYADFIIHHENAYKDSIIFDDTNYITKQEQDKLLGFLEQQSSIETVLRRLSFKGQITNQLTTTQILGEGLDVKQATFLRGKAWAYNTTFGKPLTEGTNEILLGEDLSRILGCEFKKDNSHFNFDSGYKPHFRPLSCFQNLVQITSYTTKGQANAVFLTISGITNYLYREIDSRFVQINLESAQKLLNTDSVSSINIKLKPNTDKQQFLRLVRNYFRDNNLKLKISSWKENAFGDIYRESMSFLFVLRGFFLTVILFIVLFSILTTQNRIVYERLKETAILRSLGFKKQFILKVFLMEAFIITCFASLIGLFISFLISFIIKEIGIYYLIGILSEEIPFIFVLNLKTLSESFIGILLMMLFATYYPYSRSLKKSIAQVFSKD